MVDSTDSETQATETQETEETMDIEVVLNAVADAAAAFSKSVTMSNKVAYVNKRQKGGRWVPAFPETSLEKQEAYIERMIARDRELNLG